MNVQLSDTGLGKYDSMVCMSRCTGPHIADIRIADTKFISSAFGFCCEVKFTLLKAHTGFLNLLWKVVISIIFQYVRSQLFGFFLFYRKMLGSFYFLNSQINFLLMVKMKPVKKICWFIIEYK